MSKVISRIPKAAQDLLEVLWDNEISHSTQWDTTADSEGRRLITFYSYSLTGHPRTPAATVFPGEDYPKIHNERLRSLYTDHIKDRGEI